jgi:hypothetical protein
MREHRCRNENENFAALLGVEDQPSAAWYRDGGRADLYSHSRSSGKRQPPLPFAIPYSGCNAVSISQPAGTPLDVHANN